MKVIFFGSPTFAVAFLNHLVRNEDIDVVAVVTQPPKASGRSKRPQPSPVNEAASAYEIPVLTPETLKDEAIQKELAGFEADIYVVVAYGLILPKYVLAIPKQGVINVHPSLLPKFRGPIPMPAAILAGDIKTGVTIMKMDAKMDHGPILAQLEFPLKDMDYPELEQYVAYKGPELLTQALLFYAERKLTPKEQDHDKATYCKLLDRDSGHIEWSKQTAAEIERMIRAYRPWPGTWTTWNGERLKILDGSVSAKPLLKKPGSIFQKDGQTLVACKKGALVLEELQLAGKKPMQTNIFLNGNKNFATSNLV